MEMRAKNPRRRVPLREVQAVYFANAGNTKPWQIKKVLMKALSDRERRGPPPICFVRHIGNSIFETIIDKESAPKATAYMLQWSYKLLKNIDPLRNLIKKKGANETSNDAIANATKCKEKAQSIVEKFKGPEVVQYYKYLIQRAKDEIEKLEAPPPAAPTPSEDPPPATPISPRAGDGTNSGENNTTASEAAEQATRDQNQGSMLRTNEMEVESAQPSASQNGTPQMEGATLRMEENPPAHPAQDEVMSPIENSTKDTAPNE